jgi:prepilin-type N-terminal cleavage/methylation domain-containing protein
MRGYTLIELLFVLLLVGVTTASLAPYARRQRDRALVTGARESMVGLVAEARSAAVEAGGASVRIGADPPKAEVRSGARILRSTDIAEDYGVGVSLGGSGYVEVAYDALGLGRVASQTIAFTRGNERAELVVSGYGRVRRR